MNTMYSYSGTLVPLKYYRFDEILHHCALEDCAVGKILKSLAAAPDYGVAVEGNVFETIT